MFTLLSIQEWQEFVDAHQHASIFHHRRWLELIRDYYRFAVYIPAIKQGGRIGAAIPFLEARTLWNQKKLVSLPFTDTICVLYSDESASQELADSLQSDKRFQQAEIRTDRPWARSKSPAPWVRSQLDLVTSVSRKLDSSVQRNLRKAERNHLRFERRTDPDAMEQFFKLHVLTRRKLGVPVQTRGFFRQFYDQIIASDLGHVGLVVQGGVPIAAGVFMCLNHTMVYKYGASDPRAVPYRPNELMIFESIHHAREVGCHTFDFGISCKHHEGLRRFKRKWGATETDVFRESLADCVMPAGTESRALDITSAIIRNSPSIVCRTLGAILYRYSQ